MRLKFTKPLLNHTIISITSRILGFFREITIVFLFGIGYQTDALTIVLKLFNMFKYIFLEGIISQMFLPLLIEYRKSEDRRKTINFLSNASGTFLFVFCIIALTGIALSNWIIYIFTPGLIDQKETLRLAVTLMRGIFPYLIINSLTTFINVVLHAWKLFYQSSFSQIVFNTCLIILLLMSNIFRFSIKLLTVLMILSGIIQLYYQTLCLKRIQIFFVPKINPKNPSFQKSLKILYSSISFSSINQCNTILNNVFLSFLPVGSFSWLYYSEKISNIPIGIFGVSLNTVLFPKLLKNILDKSIVKFYRILHYGVELSFLISVFLSILTIFLSYPLVITIFQYRKLDMYHIHMIQNSLKINACGIVSYSLLRILISTIHVIKDVRTHFRMSFINLILSQIINVLLFDSLKHIGISLSNVLISWFDIFFLSHILYKKGIYILPKFWRRIVLKIFISSISTILFLHYMLKMISDWQELNIFFRILYLIMLILASFLNYSSIFLLLNKLFREIKL